jgi:pimeloyl-ACP methyl ester carboxylesterase
LVAVAPRSYWKSTPTRPSERGILSDYTHALDYTIKRWPDSRIILYGHSLGGSAAVCLTSALDSNKYSNVQGLILENPFASIPEMVKALYPQRWLPYHYLTPFVWDRWDAVHAASNMSQDSLLRRLSNDMLVLLSEKDELVPNWMGTGILNAAKSKGRSSVVIRDALHENAWGQGQWVREIAKYIDDK